MQEDRKMRSHRFTLRGHRLLEQMTLHVLRQIAPHPDNSLTQGAGQPIRNHARDWTMAPLLKQ